MSDPARKIACAIYRGGTSRGIFFRESELPFSQAVRSKILVEIFGSSNPRQIDGLGGGTSVTSKAMIVGPSQVPGADVQMLFGQVSVTAPLVDWGGICGNLTTAVGPFAIDQGLVPAVEPFTDIRIYSINSRKFIKVRVPVEHGRAAPEGDYEIAGVAGKGARIALEFVEPAGALTGKLLPTGAPRDLIVLDDGRRFTVSIVDAGNVVVFCRPEEVGLRGDELPAELDANPGATKTLEAIRSAAAERLGLVTNRSMATANSPGLPKIGFVCAPRAYQTTTGRGLGIYDIDIVGRVMTMQTPHHAFMGGGAICTAAAAAIRDTLVHEACGKRVRETGVLRIGHPSGVMDVSVEAAGEGDDIRVASVTIFRTARRILEGTAFVSEASFSETVETE